MTHDTTTHDSSEIDRDERLAALVAEMLEARRRGEETAAQQLLDAHPELAEELQSLWMTAIVAEELAPESVELDLMDDNAARTQPESLVRVPAAGAELPRICGDYELLEELGRGGMGVVYKARQTSLGRTVALKMVLRGPLASAVDLARFQAESEAAAQLDHPHLVSVYEVGEWEGQPFFSMKYVEGTTLARRLANGPLDGRAAAALLAPVARAVAAAHRAGVLHRDLKPSNILIDHEGHAYVSDFGLAKRVEMDSDLTHSGAIIGTPSYMAPEQAAGNRGTISPASDVYSLGVVLYEALTGRPPFQAATPVDTILLLLEQEPLPLRLLNRQIDPDLEMIVLKCLEKSPSLRYGSADELADDLEAYLATEPVSARKTSLVQWFTRMFRETHHAPVLEQWGLLWMLHSAVILVLCLLTAAFQWRMIDTPLPYLGIWTVGLGAWAVVFWGLRRRGGPITFVERQIAHVWAAGVFSSTLLFLVEVLLGLPVLTLSPVLAILGGVAFLVKAAILSGAFYVQACANFACVLVMARWPEWGLVVFGVVNALSFFVPGWKYYRRRSFVSRD